MTRILLASHNPGKLQEMRALLASLPIELSTPADLALALQVDEAGQDYAANAQLKAAAFARAAGCWVLADDTGLEVDALGGAPGLHSHRLLEDHPTHPRQAASSDAERRRVLLAILRPFPRPWTARFRCAVALCGPQGTLDLADGTCPGQVIPEERGQAGFGYDRIFLVEGTDRTLAELGLEEKNRLSHRGRAVAALMPRLRSRLGLDPAP
jgi:XTP/dITP diphosphohydrolase